MKKQKTLKTIKQQLHIISAFIVILIFLTTLHIAHASTKKIKRPIVVNKILNLIAQEQSKKTSQQPISCIFEHPKNPSYKSKFIATIKKGVVAKGEIFKTEVYIQNQGNMPWFSSDSGCPYLITYLGTDKKRDRESQFATTDLIWDSAWRGKNRIKMETKRVNPGQVAKFTFWSKAPEQDGYYREYFTPVIEGITWLNNGTFKIDKKVGEPKIDFEQKKYWKLIDYTTEMTKIDFKAEKTIDVNISTQKMQLKLGDQVIKTFRVSTGKPSTPTPTGITKITHKQEVRVAGGYPHYIMPKWMTYRGGGYGIHALPSLANDHGVFWREALNHIGQRRSHGCIRLLPKDAEYAYNFADIGTKVVVHW